MTSRKSLNFSEVEFFLSVKAANNTSLVAILIGSIAHLHTPNINSVVLA